MNAQIPPILKLDIGGRPIEWIPWQQAATLYARDRVKWEGGGANFLVRGGIGRTGAESSVEINSIIAVHERRHASMTRIPPLTNRALFARDGMRCCYCGEKFPASRLTRDHVVARARGGRDEWSNLLSACSRCNGMKADKSCEEANMFPLVVPYTPDPARYLLLIASGRVTGCQQAFLESIAKPGPPGLH